MWNDIEEYKSMCSFWVDKINKIFEKNAHSFELWYCICKKFGHILCAAAVVEFYVQSFCSNYFV